MSYITAIGTANPPYKIAQDHIANFMIRAMDLDHNDTRKLKAVFRLSGIDYRYSVLEDYAKLGDFSFYPNTDRMEPFPSTEQRLSIFKRHALPLSIMAIRHAMQERPEVHNTDITHLIVVCCTGMYAPGLDIDIVKSLQLRPSVKRTCINFMGCYAAFNALKLGDAICKAEPAAKVLIVCTELCSLHFQKTPTENNLLANALFADGSAAVLMEAHTVSPKSFQALNFYNDLLSEGDQDMAWEIGNAGFEMKLSSYVPDMIRRGIKHLTSSLLESLGKTWSEVHHFAIHPGGRKVLEVIEEELSISKTQNTHAYRVLRNYGNMSSPTVLFVLKEIFSSLTIADHKKNVLSLAFGPGLTIESTLFKIKMESANG